MLTKDRIPGETAAAYRAAEAYFALGPARNRATLSGKLAKWAKAWSWVERAADYDAANNAMPADSRETAARNTLLKKVDDMLAFPLAEVTHVTHRDMQGNDKQVTTVHPAGWNLNTALRFLTTARAMNQQPTKSRIKILLPRRHSDTGIKIE
jgi:hypothetical protein